MSNILIVVNGFLGDILYASSVANPLSELGYKVYFRIKYYQPYELLMNNPYIIDVGVNELPDLLKNKQYKEYSIGNLGQSAPATIQYQQHCDILKPTLEYKVYTNELYDNVAKKMLNYIKRPIIAYPANWKERTFLFTKEQYFNGIDKTNNLGYGNKRRDTDCIIKELSKDYAMLEVGFPDDTPQSTAGGLFTTPIFSMTASLLKYCDWMIGAEGGLTNLAAGIGTKCIITTDFIYQVYGPNGSVKQIPEPQMGPKVYFPNTGHVHLDPFLDDDNVIKQIRENIG